MNTIKMIQQSHQHLADESSPLLKYLPLTSLLLTGSSTSQQPTIFFTPQNYMLVLSYCTSLEKEIQGLKNQLKKTQNANAQLWNKIHNLETLLRQPKNGKNVEATPKFGSATSFAMINNSRIQRMNVSRNQQREFDCGDSFFDREIINLLKEENQSLKKKIQKLYKQNLKITENYQKYLKLTLKDARSLHFKEASDQQSLFQKVEIMDTFSNCQIQPFSNHNSFFYSHNTRTSVVEPVINGILSEPNSCEISFQALPSFKSMDDMSSKHIRFDSTKFF